MPLSEITGRYHQNDSDDLPRSISWQQLLALHVAANYKLRRSSMGWWADGHVFADGALIVHSGVTIKSLLKKGLLEGNPRGEAIALGGWDGISTMEPPIPMLWASEKGKKLLAKIAAETELVFDKEAYQVVEPGPDEGDVVLSGYCATEREAALAYDRVAILLYGDDAETNLPPEESEHVILPDEVMRQINALKTGRGRLQ